MSLMTLCGKSTNLSLPYHSTGDSPRWSLLAYNFCPLPVRSFPPTPPTRPCRREGGRCQEERQRGWWHRPRQRKGRRPPPPPPPPPATSWGPDRRMMVPPLPSPLWIPLKPLLGRGRLYPLPLCISRIHRHRARTRWRATCARSHMRLWLIPSWPWTGESCDM